MILQLHSRCKYFKIKSWEKKNSWLGKLPSLSEFQYVHLWNENSHTCTVRWFKAGSANFSVKNQKVYYFWFCGPWDLCCNYSTLPLSTKAAKGNMSVNEWAGLHPNNTLCTKKRQMAGFGPPAIIWNSDIGWAWHWASLAHGWHLISSIRILDTVKWLRTSALKTDLGSSSSRVIAGSMTLASLSLRFLVRKVGIVIPSP